MQLNRKLLCLLFGVRGNKKCSIGKKTKHAILNCKLCLVSCLTKNSKTRTSCENFLWLISENVPNHYPEHYPTQCRFHPILVTWFLVVFGDKVMKILRNSLFYFSFCLARLALQTENIIQKITQLKWRKIQKRSYVPKYVMSRA